MREIHFIVSFWGDRFRKDFLERCLPSLGGIFKHRLVIACPEQDMMLIPDTVAYDWIKIGEPEDSSDAAKFRHMTHSHRLLLDHVHARRGLACQIMPDAVYSPGMIPFLEERASRGYHAVLAPALRLSEEGLRHDLNYNLPLRSCAVRNLYPDVSAYNFAERMFARWPSFVYWRGLFDFLIVHTSYFAYLLLDLGAVEKLDHSSFDCGLSIENRWLSDNFQDLARVHVVQDQSVMVLSWTPVPEFVPLPPVAPAGFLRKGYRLRRMREFHRRMGDHVKADVMRRPIYWGQSGIENAPLISRSRKMMRVFFGDVYPEFNYSGSPLLWPWWLLLRALIHVDLALRDLPRNLRRLKSHLVGHRPRRGDPHRPSQLPLSRAAHREHVS